MAGKKSYTCLVLAACMLLCGCGGNEQSAGSQAGTEGEGGTPKEQISFAELLKDGSRYVDTAVELPSGLAAFSGVVQEGGTIRLTDASGVDLVSTDGGKTYTAADDAPDGFRNLQDDVNMAVSPDGDRLAAGTGESRGAATLYKADGNEVEVSGIGGTEILYPYYCGGEFYLSQSDRVYRLDTSTGEAKLLLDGVGRDDPFYLASDGKLLYVMYARSLVIYDLEQGTVSGQDEVLESFLKKEFIYRVSSPYGAPYEALLYPWGTGVYVVASSGLYWHELYGEEMELVVDGSTSRIGTSDREFVGMAVLEGETPEFLVGFVDGSLLRCSHDPDAPPLVTVKVYSLYESDNIRTLIRSFKKAYPDITVSYEIGFSSGHGATVDDALKNLAMEMGAGTGPDILAMDDLPLGNYVEKGALMELSGIREGLEDEDYFLNVLDGFAGDSGTYTLPLAFAVPVLAGDSGKIKDLAGVETLTGLTDMLEATKREVGAQIPIIDVQYEEDVLRLLAESSQGAWVSDDGSLDTDAVGEYLAQAKRLWDIYIEGLEGLPEQVLTWGASWPIVDVNIWDYPAKSVIERRFGCLSGVQNTGFNRICLRPDEPFYGGFLSSMGGDFPYFSVVQEYMGDDYCMLPGQQYGTALVCDMLSINSATEHPEECRMFLEYALSAEFQGNAALDGTPVSRVAYRQGKEKYNTPERVESSWDNAREYILPAFDPSEETYEKFEGLLDSVTGVNYCEAKVFETVFSYGKKVLKEGLTVEEAVKEIERQLKLYLAE